MMILPEDEAAPDLRPDVAVLAVGLVAIAIVSATTLPFATTIASTLATTAGSRGSRCQSRLGGPCCRAAALELRRNERS